MLTEAQLVTVAEITQETFATVEDLSSSLNASQEASIVLDLATWATIRDVNSHVKLAPGATGAVDYDNERAREAIRQRIRKAFGLSLKSAEVNGPGSEVIEHIAVF